MSDHAPEAVLYSVVVLSTFLLQLLGFFTPYWSCDFPPNTNTSCVVEGLFYTCPTTDSCHPNVKDEDVLGLCATCFSITCFAALIIICACLSDHDDMNWGKEYKGLFILFLFGQLLGGIAAVLLMNRYDVIGWSAILFTTLGLPVFVIVAIYVTGLIIICCGNSNDDN